MPVRRARDLLERLLGGAHEAGAKQQVLGRVAGHRELREEDEIGARALRLLDAVEDQRAVAVEVADDRVDLCERDPHAFQTISRLGSAAEPDRVQVVLEDLVDPGAQGLRRVVLGVEVAAGERVELARREREHERGRALRRRPRRVVAETARSSPSSRGRG